MMTKKTKSAAILGFLVSAFVGSSCVNEKHGNDPAAAEQTEQSANSETSIPYDLSRPEKFNMPQNLFEISGITFYKGDSKTIYAIQDEDGDLFNLALGDKSSKFTKFGGSGDYEDLAIIDDHFIVLKSNGELHTFPMKGIDQPEASNVVKTKDLVPKAEYEGLATDEEAGMVYILDKEVKKGKADGNTIYAFKFDGGKFTPGATTTLSFKEIGKLAGESKMKFRPSALTKNPLTGEWYIISSINKLLVVTDADFKIKATAPLKGDNFNQPEGIAFDKAGNLYISNEGGTLAAGNVLKFSLKK
ncbi:SdiA-regulated domain-containing protein [Pedobacter sandarakinus]|uniref:SdiA-regulated domain-containing protein n=1 Tax=Pedobacter sandarakinus TaxID=353156 RepID=UPI002246AFED|nr:SdiA-regulated domain-containing protein [Pedobacter sandarakinus]MCX2574983.1 SdiA-regulated domain-containing protein [Pedobacter sandarakinus]